MAIPLYNRAYSFECIGGGGVGFQNMSKEEGNSICCYFRQKDMGIKFQLAVYRRQKDEPYKLNKTTINSKICPVGMIYLIPFT